MILVRKVRFDYEMDIEPERAVSLSRRIIRLLGHQVAAYPESPGRAIEVPSLRIDFPGTAENMQLERDIAEAIYRQTQTLGGKNNG